MTYVYIIAGAAIGAPLRYYLGGRVQTAFGGVFPSGTLIVNLVGCLAIGLLFGFAEARDAPLSREARLFLVTGLLGGFTTFSSFGWETVALLRNEDFGLAFLNVLLSVAVGLIAVWAGFSTARVVFESR